MLDSAISNFFPRIIFLNTGTYAESPRTTGSIDWLLRIFLSIECGGVENIW